MLEFEKACKIFLQFSKLVVQIFHSFVGISYSQGKFLTRCRHDATTVAQTNDWVMAADRNTIINFINISIIRLKN